MNKNIRRISRAVHRDLGYFLIGACFLYAISGFLVTMRDFDIDLVNQRTPITLQIPSGVAMDSLVSVWDAHRGDIPKAAAARKTEEGVRLVVPGYRIYYDSITGEVAGHKYKTRKYLAFLNRLHYNRAGHWNIMGLVFAIGFFILTISGMLMSGGKKGFARRGVYFMLAGLVIMVFLAIF